MRPQFSELIIVNSFSGCTHHYRSCLRSQIGLIERTSSVDLDESAVSKTIVIRDATRHSSENYQKKIFSRLTENQRGLISSPTAYYRRKN